MSQSAAVSPAPTENRVYTTVQFRSLTLFCADSPSQEGTWYAHQGKNRVIKSINKFTAETLEAGDGITTTGFDNFVVDAPIMLIEQFKAILENHLSDGTENREVTKHEIIIEDSNQGDILMVQASEYTPTVIAVLTNMDKSMAMSMTPEEARRFAAALIASADQVDQCPPFAETTGV